MKGDYNIRLKAFFKQWFLILHFFNKNNRTRYLSTKIWYSFKMISFWMLYIDKIIDGGSADNIECISLNTAGVNELMETDRLQQPLIDFCDDYKYGTKRRACIHSYANEYILLFKSCFVRLNV